MTDLITLDEYKSFKGLGKNDKDDKIEFLIGSVSALIKAYVGHSIIDNWDTPLSETLYRPYDSGVLYLDAFPIREIVSVTEQVGGYVGGLDSTISYPAVFNSDYSFDPVAGALSRMGRNWARNVTVVYKSGYATTPPEIKLAAIELVSHYLNEEWKPTRALQGTSITGPTPEVGGMPKHIQAILDRFKVGYY